ncbi:MAG: hypothetical protein RI957_757 [Verrucomicrobiota bacterium]|jgi:uncharacterized protein (DUF58 family)
MSDAEQPRSELSQRGALVLGLAVAAFLFGMTRTDGILASIALLVMLSFPLTRARGKGNLRGLVLDCQASHRGVTGQKFPVRLSLQRRDGVAASRDLTVSIRMPGTSGLSCPFAIIDPAADSIRESAVELTQRGEIHSIPYQIRSSFPLGLWHHTRDGAMDHSLIVVPRPIISKKLALAGWWREGMESWGSRHAAHVGEIRGLRAWRPGDSFKRVHAAASVRSYARGHGLMVADTDPPGFSPRHVTVMFHSYAVDRAIIRPEMFERALAYLSGTLRHLSLQSLAVTLVADFDGWLEQPCRNRRELQELCDHFSRVRRQAGTELHELQRVQTQLDPQSSLVVISDMPVSRWRSAIIRREIPTLVIPVHASETRLATPSRK